MISFFTRHYATLLICLLFFSFSVRIVNIANPSAYMFDEVYHAITAKLIARDDVRAYEWWNPAVEPNTAVDWLHPPIAKYFQALGILTFGENALGWRFSSVVFGTLIIFLVVRLTDVLFKNKALALLAGLLAAMDGLLLVLSRIAMNDIHVTFFILLTLLFYAKHRDYISSLKSSSFFSKYLVLTGITAGLAMGSKWSGLYVLLPLFIFEEIFFADHFSKMKKDARLSFIIQRIAILILLPITVYVLSYSHMFLQGKSLFCTKQIAIQGECYYEVIKDFSGEKTIWEGYVSHFFALHRQIWWYQTNLDATHPYQSRPLEWFLNLKPVWFHVVYEDDKRGDIFAQGNTALFWLGGLSMIAVLVFLISVLIKNISNKQTNLDWKNNTYLKLSLITLTYLSVWVPWQFSPRIMFFYHYTPAVPFLCIITAYVFYTVLTKGSKSQKYFISVFIGIIILNFFLFYPNWTGIPVPLEVKDKLYFALESWK